MVDWGDPELIDTIMVVYSGMCCFLFGMYLWYLALSFHKVELGLLTGRTQLQLSHGPYLIARYCCLATLIMLVWMPIVAKAFPSPSSSCPGTWYTRLVLAMGETALSAASYNLSLRAMILWNERKIVLWTLRIICLGQLVYSFVAAMIGTQQQWDPNHTYCTVGIVPSAKNVIMALLIFTLSWDAFILVMTLLGIRRKQLQGSAISVALLTQGMGYVAAQVTVIIPVLLGLLLQLNGECLRLQLSSASPN
ncbi:uncharacterized protein PHACADRAFT_210731 [Phanerochaete carnosa HHB-10118-sp]|uniref:Uncharacterized protein n=1 Tax=Phanerochaete carnosa (strain HHB-10118-sp) TaxID=650164 RepID=K5VNE0_PHACS|nr:uncharacterized protein PHACADRAFT_210731 [Phanerochaete carnosa HHB-10118-sp]EKM52973.1 hypothetical protein PHACADRAFT_210731 [Phanerochaete carnosa HHB-10118-sp]